MADNWAKQLKDWRRQHEEDYAKTILQPPPMKTLYSLLQLPGVYIVMGERGGGKSGLVHRAVYEFHKNRGVPACLHLPGISDSVKKRIQRQLLPPWLKVTSRRSEWPERCIVIYDEAAQTTHARRSQSGDAVELDDLIGISRQRDQMIFFIAHHSRKIDINLIHEVTGIIWKKPTYAHQMWERSELSDFSMRAFDFFQGVLGPAPNNGTRRKVMEAGLMLDLQNFGFFQFKNKLAPWWTDDLSRVFRNLELRNKGA